jgi:hypothetical protein
MRKTSRSTTAQDERDFEGAWHGFSDGRGGWTITCLRR